MSTLLDVGIFDSFMTLHNPDALIASSIFNAQLEPCSGGLNVCNSYSFNFNRQFYIHITEILLFRSIFLHLIAA